MKIANLDPKLSILCAFIFFASNQVSLAGSATWLANPPGNLWHGANNWTPVTVPNGPNDTATFAASSQTNVTISANTEVNGINFSATGGNSYTLTNNAGTVLTISGAGIMNNSGVTQSLIISGQLGFSNSASIGNFIVISESPNATMTFSNSASAGTAILATNNGSSLNFSGSATAANAHVFHSSLANVNFFDSATADSATFSLTGRSSTTFRGASNAGSASFTLQNSASQPGGDHSSWLFTRASLPAGSVPPPVASVVFQNNSSAANANFSVNSGGSLGFSNTASAANSTITDNGGVISFADDSNTGNVANLPIAGGGRIQFSGNSSAGTTTLMATGGSSIVISGNATTDKAGIQIFGSSVLDVSAHVTPAVISSIAGDGTIRLGSSALSVSADNDTTFSGHIQDTSPGGSIIKDGTGTLTLTNSNNYRGPTLVNFGTLHASVDLPFGAPADTDYGAYVSIGNNGTLTLDSGATNNYIANSASLFLGNGATVNLNFTGNPDRLRSLSINGVTLPPGIYGSVASGAPNQLPQLNGPGKITATIKAVSRKIQGAAGAFDIDLPLAGPPGIECRLGGASHDYRVVVTFFDNVTYSFVSVPSNTALVSNSSGNGTNTVTIDLTSVVNAQTTQIIIHNLNDGTSMFDVYIPMTVLTADVNASKVVNASDVIQVKAQVGQPVTASNFRSDINCNGTITSSDVIQPKLTSGTFVP